MPTPLMLAILILAGCPRPSVPVLPPPTAHSPDPDRRLLDLPAETDRAPTTFHAEFQTSEGTFVVRVDRVWAPLGVDRFHHLVKIGFYDGCAFFRTIDGFVTQFGIHPDPAVASAWVSATIDDDPVRVSNTAGRIAFAKAGPNSRTTQLFINLTDNAGIDGSGHAPFGEVVEGIDVLDRLHRTGEGAPSGPGPSQAELQRRGRAYLAEFPDIDHIKRVTIK